MRRVKIVATVGPACSDTKILAALLREGADVLRINASHTTPEGLREWIHKIREAAEIVQKNISILVDLQGPRVRTGRIKKGRIVLKPKTQINIRIGPDIGSNSEIVTPCREFSRMIRAGDRVLLDNGVMELEAQFVEPECVQCRVITGGVLGENKGINLPNAPVTLPALTTKDLADLKIAEELNVDYVALSFVRSEEDVLTIKQWLEKAGKNIPVIAKIEKPRAVNRIQQILEHTDAVMIARGDLGIEMGVEKIPAIQKRLIKFANDRKVPIITATQMLESMMHCPRPTRAEASDVANAVFDGTDAVMLSGETAIGKYPVEAVRTMSRIILEAESHVKESPENGQQATKGSELDAIVRAAKDAAHYLKAEAIVVFTVSGKTAVHISKLGSDLPIIVLTPSKEVQARLALLRGVKAFQISSRGTMDITLKEGDEFMIRNGLLKHQDTVIVVTGKRAFPEAKFMVKVHKISS